MKASSSSVWEWAQVALLAGNLGWTTLCLGGYRPETMVVTSALNAALVAVHLVARVCGSRMESGESAGERGQVARATTVGAARFHPAGWLLLPFLAYAAANVLWVTPVSWLGWLDWLGWAQMIAVFWVVLNGVRSARARATLLGALAAIGLVAVGLGAYQKFVQPDWLMMGRTQVPQFVGRASGSFGIPNSLAALLLLLLPAAIALAVRRRASAVERVLGGYLALVFAFGLVLTVSRGAWLALLLVAAWWPLRSGRGTLRQRLGWAAAVVAGMVVVLGLLFAAVPTVRGRLEAMKRDRGEISRPIMWRGAWGIFREHPVIGGGAGSYNVLFDAYRPERFQDEPRWTHNDYLNTLSDYGAAGFVLFFGAAGAIAWRCVKRRAEGEEDEVRGVGWRPWSDDPVLIDGLEIGVAAFALQLFVDFHFKIPALAMAFATVAALVVQRRWSGNPIGYTRLAPARAGADAKGRKLGMALALAAGAGVVLAELTWVRPFYQGEALRYGARQAIDRLAKQGFDRERWARVLGDARGALQRAVVLAPANAAAWADLAYATVLTGHIAPEQTPELAQAAERAANEALARSRVVPVFWVRRGVALDLQERHADAARAFVEAVRLAPRRASIWYNHAFHLGLEAKTLPQAREAVEFCLRLDPTNREAQALRERLAARSHAP